MRAVVPLAFAVAAAAVIAAIVAVALEPREIQVAAVAAPVQSADPCEGQTWPRFTPTCLASKNTRQAKP